jgi:hypothetical protein
MPTIFEIYEKWPGYPDEIWIDELSGIVYNIGLEKERLVEKGRIKRLFEKWRIINIGLAREEKAAKIEAMDKIRKGSRSKPHHSITLKGKTTCSILSAHHESLKDDPDRLSTSFIRKLSGIEGCENVPE